MNGGNGLRTKLKRATRQLMGIESINDYSIVTPMGRLVFYIIQPTNIGVLPADSVTSRIHSLLSVLKANPELEMVALNSKESFENNKNFYRDRLEKEELPAIRALLEQDIQYLDQKQVSMATAREFYFVVRLSGDKDADVFPYLSRIEKNIKDSGFTVRRAEDSDIKRMLAVYFEQNVTTEKFEDYDGERLEVD